MHSHQPPEPAVLNLELVHSARRCGLHAGSTQAVPGVACRPQAACAKVAAPLLVQAAALSAMVPVLQQARRAAAYQSFAALLVYAAAAAVDLSRTGCVAGSALPGWRAAALPASALQGCHAALLQERVYKGKQQWHCLHISMAMWRPLVPLGACAHQTNAMTPGM
jgi:hypothetical protein